MRSDKYQNVDLQGISALYIVAFMPLKSTTALTWNLIETVLCVKTWKEE